MPPALFVLDILQIGPAWAQSSYFMIPEVTGMTDLEHYAQLFSSEMGSYELFCLD
jgi:hypothetical protein